MRIEIRVIAHFRRVREPRQLRRYHWRIVQDDGRSRPLDEIYPDIESRFEAA